MLARKENEVVLHLAGKDLVKVASLHPDIAPVGNTQQYIDTSTEIHAHTIGLL